MHTIGHWLAKGDIRELDEENEHIVNTESPLDEAVDKALSASHAVTVLWPEQPIEVVLGLFLVQSPLQQRTPQHDIVLQLGELDEHLRIPQTGHLIKNHQDISLVQAVQLQDIEIYQDVRFLKVREEATDTPAFFVLKA